MPIRHESDAYFQELAVTKQRTLVVGGAGAIGHYVARLLVDTGHNVIVSSRNGDRASTAARQIPGASPAVIDTANAQLELPADVNLVIDCTGTSQTVIAEATAVAAADLIDISATTTHLLALAGLDQIFVNAGSRAITGVGLAPGLSTLLARAVHDTEYLEPITINGILDTRDEHGEGSAAFTMGKVGTDFADPTTGAMIRNFTGLRRPNLPAGFGKLLVARADFPDQYTLTNALGVPVTTNYGFTSTATTLIIAAATRIPRAGKLLDRIAQKTPRPTGTGPWLITAETTQRTAWATGTGQAIGTAAMTQLAAAHLAVGKLKPGVHSIDQLMELDDQTLAGLAHHGIAVAVNRYRHHRELSK